LSSKENHPFYNRQSTASETERGERDQIKRNFWDKKEKKEKRYENLGVYARLSKRG
jgi:hypothetical protein